MDDRTRKSALLNSSSVSDIIRSGGLVSITDLFPFTVDELLAADHLVHRAEVVQVLTLDVSGLTFAASTKYTILVGNVRNEQEANTTRLIQYRFTSPADISALTSEAIIDALVQQINDRTNNFLIAVKLGVDSMTITDDAGYYPSRPSARTGPSEFSNIDGLQDSGGATFVQTTAPVVEVGDGTRILADVPVIEPMTGNLASGELNTPDGAVAGQFYSTFDTSHAKSVSHQAVSGLRADKILHQRIFVDDGLGVANTNLAGHAAFLRAFEDLIFIKYKDDPNALVLFLDNNPIYHSKSGGTSTGATGDENLITFQDGTIDHHVLGVGQTIVYPPWTTNGLDIVQDIADNEGLELSAPVEAISLIQYVVGQDVCSLRAELSMADVSDTDDLAIGFRKKEAYQANVDDYDELASLAIDVSANPADVKIQSILNNAATISTDTLKNFADGETHVWEIRVGVDGVVQFLIDDVDVSDVQAVAYVFDAGEVLIPFVYELSAGATDPGTILKKFFSIGNILKR